LEKEVAEYKNFNADDPGRKTKALLTWVLLKKRKRFVKWNCEANFTFYNFKEFCKTLPRILRRPSRAPIQTRSIQKN
jgi:hypothetical protein